jgi:hypothetical protein
LRIVVDCTVNPSLLKGRYREWYQALLDLQGKWPKQVVILVDEGSENVLETDSSNYYPQEPDDYTQLAIQRHSLEPQGTIAEFEEIERTKYRTSCQTIADNIDFCREFIRTVRSHQKRFESSEQDDYGAGQFEEASASAEASAAPKKKRAAKGKAKTEAAAGDSIDSPKQNKISKRKSLGDDKNEDEAHSSGETEMKKRKKAAEGEEQGLSSKTKGKRPMC